MAKKRKTPPDPLHAVLKIRPGDRAPKYRQIVDQVIHAVQQGKLGKGSHLPSINEVCAQYALARETVVKAYKTLKEKGLVDSQPGKGFYVATDHYTQKTNVFVLFDVLATPYKERLYQGIRDELKGKASLDVYFHHHNPNVFRKLLDDARGRYEYYVVMPFPDDSVRDVLAAFDQEKLLLLDIDIDFPGKQCAVIRQNHDEQLEQALDSGVKQIKRYQSFCLVFPRDKNHPTVIKTAFRRFCRRHQIEHRVMSSLSNDDIHPSNAYLVIEDDDLVTLVKHAKAHHLRVGRDLGFISYNDTPLKEIVEGGVSVISIDFYAIGRRTAEQIVRRETIDVLQPTELILRESL